MTASVDVQGVQYQVTVGGTTCVFTTTATIALTEDSATGTESGGSLAVRSGPCSAGAISAVNFDFTYPVDFTTL